MCDEWAVNRTGNRLALANCLTTVAQWRLLHTAPEGSLAAAGQRSSLSSRVERLVENPAEASRGSRVRAAVVTTLALVLIAGLIGYGPKATFAVPEISQEPEPSQAAEVTNELPAAEAGDIAALREEISLLAEELRNLNALIDRFGKTPELDSLSTRLSAHMEQIEQQSAVLEAVWNTTENEHP